MWWLKYVLFSSWFYVLALEIRMGQLNCAHSYICDQLQSSWSG